MVIIFEAPVVVTVKDVPLMDNCEKLAAFAMTLEVIAMLFAIISLNVDALSWP